VPTVLPLNVLGFAGNAIIFFKKLEDSSHLSKSAHLAQTALSNANYLATFQQNLARQHCTENGSRKPSNHNAF